MKKITAQDIEAAYVNTCNYQNDYTIESSIEGERGGWNDTVYELINRLSINGFNFVVQCLFSDGGIHQFLIKYKLKDFEVILIQVERLDDKPFYTIEDMVKWLNDKEERLMKTCMLVKLEFELNGD